MTSSLASATGTDSCTRHGQPSAVPPAALPEAPASKSGQAAPVEPEYAAGAARPWPSVKQPTVRTDRPRTPTPSAIRPWTPRHGGLQRDKATHGGTQQSFKGCGILPVLLRTVRFLCGFGCGGRVRSAGRG